MSLSLSFGALLNASTGVLLVVMERATGGSLADRLEAGPLGPEASARLAADLLAGLAAVHRAGLVHRDLKPSNVLLTDKDRFVLADFGIAYLGPPARWGEGAAPEDGSAATPVYALSPAGTPPYMSPEQARGEEVGPASDLYSAGLVLYEAVTGRPFVPVEGGTSRLEIRARVAAAQPPSRQALAGLDAPLAEWFGRALAPDAGDRFTSAEAMAKAYPGVDAQGTR